MPIRLFVGNLPYDTSEAELKAHFATIAPVTYLTIPLDRESGRSRNFAFVEFSERAQAEEAIRRLNNQLFNDRPLSVSEARPREERRPSSAPVRAPLSRAYSPAEPMAAPTSPSGEKPARNFGPDAAPPRRGKGKGGPKTERGPKGPMREVVSRQFGSDDDDDDDYDFEAEHETDFDYEDEDAENDGAAEAGADSQGAGAEREADK